MQGERECFSFKYKTSCDRITAGLPTAEITGSFYEQRQFITYELEL